MSKNKQVRICTLPLPLCPYRCSETGASRSVVFFTACDKCSRLLVCGLQSDLNCSVVKCLFFLFGVLINDSSSF